MGRAPRHHPFTPVPAWNTPQHDDGYYIPVPQHQRFVDERYPGHPQTSTHGKTLESRIKQLSK